MKKRNDDNLENINLDAQDSRTAVVYGGMRLSRRKFIGGLGAGLIGWQLQGCGGDDKNGTSTFYQLCERGFQSANSQAVMSISATADNNQLITAHNKGQIQIWQTSDGSLIRTLYITPEDGEVFSAAKMSPDGDKITLSSNFGSLVIDAQNGDTLNAYSQPSCVDVDFSPDGLSLLVASVDRVSVWDLETNEETWWGLSNISRALFSPDGTRLVVVSYDNANAFDGVIPGLDLDSSEGLKIVVYAWPSQTALSVYTGHGMDSVNAIAFSPDSTKVASCTTGSDANNRGGTFHLWEADTGNLILKSTSEISLLAKDLNFSPDGTKIVVASGRRSLNNTTQDGITYQVSTSQGASYQFDAETGELINLYTLIGQMPSQCRFIKNEQIISGDIAGLTHIWEAPSANRILNLVDDIQANIPCNAFIGTAALEDCVCDTVCSCDSVCSCDTVLPQEEGPGVAIRINWV